MRRPFLEYFSLLPSYLPLLVMQKSMWVSLLQTIWKKIIEIQFIESIISFIWWNYRMTAILKNSPWLRFLSQHIYCQSLWVFDHESRAWIKMPKLRSRKLLWPELQMCTEGHTSLLWAVPFSRQSIQPNLLAPRLFFVQKYCYRKTRTKTNEI